MGPPIKYMSLPIRPPLLLLCPPVLVPPPTSPPPYHQGLGKTLKLAQQIDFQGGSFQ